MELIAPGFVGFGIAFDSNPEGDAVIEPTRMGRATILSCPKCTSMLYETQAGDALRFRCANGHGYRPEEICPGITDSLEGLLPEIVDALTR